MSVEIKVPPLGESVSEATIAKLFKEQGAYVEEDEVLAELETEKVTLEINAPAAGVLETLSVAEGDTVEVDRVIGNIDTSGKKSQASSSAKKSSSSPAQSQDKKNSETPQPAQQSSEDTSSTRPYAPAAAKLSAESGVKPESGSGKDGRVTKGDMLAALQAEQQGAMASSAGNKANREERVRMSKLRQSIAKRLKASQDTAAILTTFNEVDMSAVMAVRSKYKELFAEKHDAKLGLLSFFVKAAVAALQEIPSINAQIEGDEIIYKNHYDIGVAVGTEQGLVVPVIRDVDALSFAGIENAVVEFGKKAREGKLTMDDMTGGTFTISNGGVYGSLLSTPIINPPQTGILGLHKIQQRPMAIQGEVKIRPMMYLALSYDHRLVDGKEAVTFLVRIKEAIEDPQRLLLQI